MSYNLTNQAIEDSFQPLLQIDSGSALRDGTGSLVDNINVTASYALTASFAENVIPIDTGSLLTTASFDNGTRNLTFTKGDSSTFSVNIPDASGSILPSGVVSGSSQIILTDTTGNLGGNRITGSVQSAVSASYALSASYAVSASYEIIKEISSSFADHTNWSGIYGIPSGLVSGSVQVSDITGSSLVTASNDFSQITFTKGDGTTFQLDATPRRVVETVKNKNGFMPKGTPVYVSGSTGNELHVFQADAGNPLRVPATFILDQDLDPEESGLGILSGFINGVDTSLFAEGANIYLAVGGGYTDVQPTGSAFIQKLGNVVKSDLNGSGVISGAGRVNALPNLTSGYAWVGDGNGVPQQVSTASWDSHSDLTQLNQFTASQEIYNQGINNYTSSTDARLSSIELETSSLDGRVTSLENFSSSLDATFATDAQLAAATQSLINSIATKLDTGSYLTDSASFDGRIDSLENFSSSLDANFVSETEFGIYTSSNDSKVQSLIDATGSYATTGSNNFIGNQDINGIVSSTQNQSNTHYNPQLITDNVTIPTGQNGLIIGNTTIAGDYTVEGNSEVFVFTEPTLIDTTIFATTGSNSFIGNQTISGSLIASGSYTAFGGATHTLTGRTRIVAPNNDETQLPGLIVEGYTQFIGGPLQLTQTSAKVNSFSLANDGQFKVEWPNIGSFFNMQNGAFQFSGNTGIGMFFDKPGIKFQVTDGSGENHILAMSAQPGSFPALNVSQYTGSCAGIIYNQTNNGNTPTKLLVGAKVSSSFDDTLYTDMSFYSSGSANISTLKLRQQDPLPAGAVGDLATSGSALYFHDGTNWRTVNLT